MFTGLFSFGAPKYPETLRDWLSDVVALRELLAGRSATSSIARLRDALLRDNDIEVESEAALLEVLHNDNLPRIVAADQGAVARKGRGQGAATFYTFLNGTNEVPSIVVMIDEFIQQLAATAASSVAGAMTVLRAHLAIDALPAPDVEDLALPGSPARRSRGKLT